MTEIVIFDLDHTLARVNVSFAFGKYLYHNNKLPLFSMLFLVTTYALHKCGICSVVALHSKAFQTIFANKPKDDIAVLVNDFLSQNSSSLFRPYLLERLKTAKSHNAHIVLQSSSPECLVLPIAKLLGIHTCAASRYETKDDGTYSSVSEVVTGHTKRCLFEQLLKESPFERANSTAYTDSVLDLPLLEAVGNVVAVCPDAELRKIALARNWQIWDETESRKRNQDIEAEHKK